MVGYLYLAGVGLDLEELADGLYEALIVLVAHPLDVLLMHLDPVGQAVLEGLHLLPLVHSPVGTHTTPWQRLCLLFFDSFFFKYTMYKLSHMPQRRFVFV